MENPENNRQEIIELHGVETDEGEIKYTRRQPAKKTSGSLDGLIKGVLGIAIGVALFLVLVTFFVYVFIPLVVIILLWSLLSRLFKK